MKIHKITENLVSEGPGLRTAIWTQGCSIKCPGCFNIAAQNPKDGDEIKISEIITLIKSNKKIRGVTIAGGEPFDQLSELKLLLSEIKKACPHLDILLYSGYEFSTIKKHREMFEVAKLSDILISGPFIKEKSPDPRSWIGSTNQKITFFNDQLKKELTPWPTKKTIEIHVKNQNLIHIFGEKWTFN